MERGSVGIEPSKLRAPVLANGQKIKGKQTCILMSSSCWFFMPSAPTASSTLNNISVGLPQCMHSQFEHTLLFGVRNSERTAFETCWVSYFPAN